MRINLLGAIPAAQGLRYCILSAALLLLPLLTAVRAEEPVIELGTEINAGQSAGGNQYQCDLRVNPLNPANFCITGKHGLNEGQTILLRTADAGKTWSTIPLPSTGDPDNVFDLAGNAHWMFMDKNNGKKLGYRKSTDGGKTFSTQIIMDAVDHPHIACDRNAGSKFKGSIYIAGRNISGSQVTIFRSRDAGATWQKTVLSPGTQLGLGFVFNPVVLSDGTLVIPIRTKNNMIVVNNTYAGNNVDLYCLRSTDGGVTFDKPVYITTKTSPAKSGAGGFYGMSAGWGKYNDKDRVYFSYVQEYAAPTPAKLMLTTSDNGGLTWSAPRVIATPPVSGWGAGSCSVMVNKDNVVGVQFYGINGSYFNMFFTASTDGGATFCTPVKLTTVDSMKEPGSNQPRYYGQDQVYGDTDSEGKFHTVWTDSRNGATQYTIYTRTVTVKTAEEEEPELPQNTPPVIHTITATPAAITLPETSTLAVTASDADGDALSYKWTKVSGPAAVTLSSATAASTQATFTAAGTYVFQVTVSDGQATDTDQVQVVVAAKPMLKVEVNGTTAAYAVEVFDAGQDTAGGIEILDSGETLRLSGNRWKKVDLGAYTITANTMLEFDFSSNVKGEVCGIGFDGDSSCSYDLTFQLAGTQSWGLQAFRNYSSTTGAVQHYSIPVGQYYTGSRPYLFFACDHDVTAPTLQVTFTKVRVYERSVTIGECGTVKATQTSAGQWNKVTLKNLYSHPVVIMGPASGNSADPLTVRVRNIIGDSFEWQFDEYDYLDGKHAEESVSYLVVEAGSYRLADGRLLQAGTTKASGQLTTIDYPVAFAATPITLMQTVTCNDSSAVVTRQLAGGAASVMVCLQNEEGKSSAPHAEESVSWLACENGLTSVGNLQAATILQDKKIDQNWTAFSFAKGFSTAPVIFASLQTLNGSDTAGIRFKSLTTVGVSLMLEEEKSGDDEIDHVLEGVGILTLQPGEIYGDGITVIK